MCWWSGAAPPALPPACRRSRRERASRWSRRVRSSPATRRRRREASRPRSPTDDSPELHADDVWRSSHETADMGLVRVLTSEAPGAIHWLEEHGVEFTRENGGYRLARCGGASRKRLLQVGDRTGHAITTALRDTARGLERADVSEVAARPSSSAIENGWRARLRRARVRGRGRRPRCRRSLLPRGRGARASSPRIIPARRARRPGSPSASAPSRATSTRSSTTRTAAPGRRTCRATRSPRRRAPTAPCS